MSNRSDRVVSSVVRSSSVVSQGAPVSSSSGNESGSSVSSGTRKGNSGGSHHVTSSGSSRGSRGGSSSVSSAGSGSGSRTSRSGSVSSSNRSGSVSNSSSNRGGAWPIECEGVEFEGFLDQWEKLHFSIPSVVGAELDFDTSVIEADMAWLQAASGSKHERVCALIRRRQAEVESSYLNVESIKGFEGFPGFESLSELATEGAQPWVSDTFVPNRGVGTKQRSKNQELRPAIHHQLAKLQAAGLALVLPKSYMVGLEGLNLNQPHVVAKVGDSKGRVCVDETASGLNAATLVEELYARDGDLVLPTVVNFAGMVHDGAVNHNAKLMYKTDVSGAFGRHKLSAAAALLQSVELDEYVVVMLNGCFGWAAAPKCYSTVSDAITWAHNGGVPSWVAEEWADAQRASDASEAAPVYADRVVKAQVVGRVKSVTYVDDTAGSSSQRSVEGDMRQLIAIVRKLLGMTAINTAKTEGPSELLTIIGWYFDTQRMTVSPGDKGLQKMCVGLFRRLKGTRVSARALKSVVGLLRWYSQVIPHGTSQLVHLSALVVWADRSKQVNVVVSEEALGELTWWRSLVAAGLHDPSVWESDMGRIADQGRRVPRGVSVASVEMFTDASTSVGGGFVVEGLKVFGDFVWSMWERRFFEACIRSAESDAGINVLEYVTVVLAVVACKEVLKGRVVRVRVDNTAAIAWLVREKSPNMLCQAWLRLMLLTLSTCHIQIQPIHVAGKDNVTADALSRRLLDMVNTLLATGATSRQVLDQESRKELWKASGRDV